jgi:surfeit locus 1 family protein
MWSVARRPRWIAALIFALALAAAFAALGQWQLARSIQNGTTVERPTETVAELSAITKPQTPVTDKLDGQLVETTGHWVAGDYSLVADRLNRGDSGWWLLGHFAADTTTGKAAGLAVALGWSPTKAKAQAELQRIGEPTGDVALSGRYNVSDAPSDSDFTKGQITTVSSAALLNTWKTVDPGGIYGGYLTSSKAPAGLTTIYSPPPVSTVQVDLLNIFYAIEWVVFAGFAIFLWYRLVRDAWEREQEELAEQAQGALHETAEVN